MRASSPAPVTTNFPNSTFPELPCMTADIPCTPTGSELCQSLKNCWQQAKTSPLLLLEFSSCPRRALAVKLRLMGD